MDESYVYFKISPTHTNYVNRILEGYEYLGVMTTLQRAEGLCMVRSTFDTAPLVRQVLGSLDIELTFLEVDQIHDF
ncbi:DUF4911 domain-containing protein [Veillonella intestinalis]|uniref:DUF4911 domain-containing protein n=1 Tax=Veillonella intestinalis TaxID=2941341 RepID=UPI00203B0E66|nr:DUF4911 domain-containing protein [Veillonella intestinalis]